MDMTTNNSWIKNLKEGDKVFIHTNQKTLKIATILRFTDRKILLNETQVRYFRDTGKCANFNRGANVLVEYNKENIKIMEAKQFKMDAVNKLNSINWRKFSNDKLRAVLDAVEFLSKM